MQHCLGVIGIANRLAHTHDIAALLYEVLDVVVSALIRKLRQFYTLACELLVKVVKVQARWRQILHARQEHSSLQLGHGCFKLRWDQC
jgi:hypothetical protein